MKRVSLAPISINKQRSKSGGFSIIELLIVGVIIAIAAAVAAPLMRNYTKRAIIREAVAGLEAIRAAQRVYYNKYGEYWKMGYVYFEPQLYNSPCYPSSYIEGIKPGDLNGTFFSDRCFNTTDWNSFEVWCSAGSSEAPRGKDAKRLIGCSTTIYMNEEGKIATQGIPNSGYPEYPNF